MRFALAVLALVLLADVASGQRRNRDLAREGDLAVTIGFSGLDNFALSPLQGGIGLRYRVADRTVLGTALAIGGRDQTREQEQVFEDDRERDESVEQDDRFRSASLALFLEQHLGRRRSAVSPFVGAGVRVGIGNGDDTYTTRSELVDDEQGVRQEIVREIAGETESTSFDAGLLLGAEVKIVSGVTLSGAYTFGVGYSERTQERSERIRQTVYLDGEVFDEFVREEADVTVSDGWQFGVGTTQVALSVYF